MKHSFKPMLMAATMLALMLTFNSCDDILGEWSRPTPNPVTPSGGGGTATVTSISIDPTLALKVGETGQLTATVDPAGTAVTWSSDQEAVATVDANGLVTAKADGTATITATAGDKKATCTVTVTEVYTAKDYKEGSWDGTKVVFTKQTAASVTAVANSDAAVTWDAGWYTVSGNVTITGNVTLGAETHLILQDGATLTINGQLNCISSGKNLYIYGQKKGDGKLNVTNDIEAIDSYNHIDIHGGEVTASVTGDSYGLFTNYLAVYGGKLTATSGGGNGIGFYNTIDVYGGEVVATSNATSSSVSWYGISRGDLPASLTVYGGKVTATGNGRDNFPDYGSGFSCYVKSGTSGIKFYFSDNGTDWDAGTNYSSNTEVGGLNGAAATKKKFAKAE